jgi:threonine dehydrogenase-like Zn-dependent dehydrogenase
VIAFDISDARNTLALEMGADEAHNPLTLHAAGTSPAEQMRRITRGWGCDILVEAAGAALKTMPEIEKAFAPGGKMVYLGRTGERAPVMLDVLVSGAASIVGARGHAGMSCFPQVIRLLEHNRLNVSPMITSRRPFESFMDALHQSCARTDGKIMIYYP